MFQGTGSDVGKSVIVAGLCRLLANRGHRVRPFKPQNMSNNAAVTADGGEIGRAQWLQARACRTPPSVDMNPVLLKPESDCMAQVVVHGRVRGRLGAVDFPEQRQALLGDVLASFARLRDEADFVIVEGAGSPAETNLRAGDIANMGFARAAGVPVVLIGDIDRGGVIASLVGSHRVLDEADRRMVAGFLINKFRGEVSLFTPGLADISRHTGWPSFGILPFVPEAARLPAEDAVSLEHPAASTGATIRIAIPMLSRIANFDDFDPLKAEPDVSVAMIPPGRPLPLDADLIILPGTKATLADLAFLRDQGWHHDLFAHVRHGGRVLGICGGYQMLGREITDADGIEGPAGTVQGLGLLDIETTLGPAKRLREVRAISVDGGSVLHGFEMHSGITDGPDCARPFLKLVRDSGPVAEGATTGTGRIAGCYLHGLFRADGFRHAFLSTLKARRASDLVYDDSIDRALDAFAGAMADNLDIEALLAAAA